MPEGDVYIDDEGTEEPAVEPVVEPVAEEPEDEQVVDLGELGDEEAATFAEGEVSAEAVIGTTPYTTLQNALDAGGTVKLLKYTTASVTDARNAQDLRMLARELKDRFGQYDNLHVYVALIHDFGGIKHDFKSREEMLRCYKELREDLTFLGITKPRMLNRKILLNSCMADDDSRMTFLPDGHIGRCEHESETGFVGSIYIEEKDTALIAAWKEKLRSRACGDCPLYPRCDLLKKCAWYADGCTEDTRAIMRINIEDQILNTYKMEINRDKKPAETDFMPDEYC